MTKYEPEKYCSLAFEPQQAVSSTATVSDTGLPGCSRARPHTIVNVAG